ncbi:hypothetical protein EBR25_14155, partial [bacterium]|nr:hypothetical protein [bacterium]
MNEQYLKRLHAYLGVKEDYATWLENTTSDEQNIRKMHSDLGITHDYETWKAASFGDIQPVKKKESPVAPTLSESSDGNSF